MLTAHGTNPQDFLGLMSGLAQTHQEQDGPRTPSPEAVHRSQLAQAALPWFLDYERRWKDESYKTLLRADRDQAFDVALQIRVMESLGQRLRADILQGRVPDVQEHIPESYSEMTGIYPYPAGG